MCSNSGPDPLDNFESDERGLTREKARSSCHFGVGDHHDVLPPPRLAPLDPPDFDFEMQTNICGPSLHNLRAPVLSLVTAGFQETGDISLVKLFWSYLQRRVRPDSCWHFCRECYSMAWHAHIRTLNDMSLPPPSSSNETVLLFISSLSRQDRIPSKAYKTDVYALAKLKEEWIPISPAS